MSAAWNELDEGIRTWLGKLFHQLERVIVEFLRFARVGPVVVTPDIGVGIHEDQTLTMNNRLGGVGIGFGNAELEALTRKSLDLVVFAGQEIPALFFCAVTIRVIGQCFGRIPFGIHGERDKLDFMLQSPHIMESLLKCFHIERHRRTGPRAASKNKIRDPNLTFEIREADGCAAALLKRKFGHVSDDGKFGETALFQVFGFAYKEDPNEQTPERDDEKQEHG